MNSAEIKLSGEMVAIVDASDFGLLSSFKWRAIKPSPRAPWYATTKIGGKNVYMHRFLLGAVRGQLSDHKNGCGLDNRRMNLRLATHSQNSWNTAKKSNGSTSKYKGVGWVAKDEAFQARIRIAPGKRISLGYFKTEEAAALAYNRRAAEVFGEFARLNDVCRENLLP